MTSTEKTAGIGNLEQALEILRTFRSANLATTISAAQIKLVGADSQAVSRLNRSLFGSADVFAAAVQVKRAAAQIDNLLHAVGILSVLPHIMQPGEKILSSSLGAAGGNFDLVTNFRIAEFKFIHWKPKANSLRLMVVLEDFIRLAEATDLKQKRELYLLDTKPFLRFMQGKTKLSTMLQKRNAPLLDRLAEIEPRWATVCDYYSARASAVAILDLHQWLPRL